MKNMLDDQILDHFEEYFLPKIESQQFESDAIDAAIIKANVLVLLFNVELPQATSS